MQWTSVFLTSKVARRIFLLFVGCALVPITVLAVLAFVQVSSQLQQDAQKQLIEMAKAQSMEIYERMLMASSEMRVLSLQFAGEKNALDGSASKDHFVGLTVFQDDGKVLATWGEPSTLFALDEKQNAHLQSGSPVLSVHPCDRAPGNCVALARSFSVAQGKTALLLAELNPDFVWDRQSLPGGLDLCMMTSSRALLFCSEPEKQIPLGGSGQPHPIFSGTFDWTQDGTRYDAAYRALLLRPGFASDYWTVAVTRSHDAVLAPVQHFRLMFPLVILLALWIVTLLSSVEIRRTLGPLEKLQAATRAVGEQHFERTVDVRSGDEFESLARSFNSMASRLGRQFHAFKTINDIDEAIFAALNRDAIIDAVLGHMPDLLPGDCFAVATFDSAHALARVRFVHTRAGKLEPAMVESVFSQHDFKQLETHAEFLAVLAGGEVPGFLAPLQNSGMASFAILPIIVDKVIYAALVCALATPVRILQEDIQQARQVADQVAVAFSHTQLIEALEQLHWGTLTALARAIDAKSAWTAGHSERVTNFAISIGREMGLSGKDLQIMQRGGLLHDIGKIGTPPAVLDKPGKLDEAETKTMQDHVSIGVRILEPIPGFQEALPIVAQHHERFDGGGYPKGLAGEQISIHARIFAVADSYDAMTSDRPYRKGLARDRAVEIIREGSGKQFDPHVVNVFMQWLAKKEGLPTELSAHAAGAGQ